MKWGGGGGGGGGGGEGGGWGGGVEGCGRDEEDQYGGVTVHGADTDWPQLPQPTMHAACLICIAEWNESLQAQAVLGIAMFYIANSDRLCWPLLISALSIVVETFCRLHLHCSWQLCIFSTTAITATANAPEGQPRCVPVAIV